MNSNILIFITFLTLVTSQVNHYVGVNQEYFSNLGDSIRAQVARDVAPLQNLGAQITQNVQQNLKPLEGLGAQIEAQVYQGLAPVRAMEMQFKMKDGVGGTTILNYLPSGKTFIIQNYQMLECKDGTISKETAQCSTNLTKFEPKNTEDYCFLKSASIVNNNVCLSTGPVSVQVINNFISCKGPSAILLTLDEYKKTCEKQVTKINYKYFANQSDPQHVKIPNENKHVYCETAQEGICEFSENKNYPFSTVVNSNIIINQSY